MKNFDLLERVLATPMNEKLRNDLLRHLFNYQCVKSKEIPIIKDRISKLNSDEIYARMKASAGGTGVSVARLLGITPQGFNNQKMRKTISGNSIIDFHIKTGVSVDWLIGSGSGSITGYLEDNNFRESSNDDCPAPSQKYLCLVETYDQNSGNVELKWCLTKHHVCLDDKNHPISGDFSALLSLIIRYKDEAGTPEKVKKGAKRHFQVRKMLAYVLGDPQIIRHLDDRAKKQTTEYKSGHIDRPGKTEFRLYSAKAECLQAITTLAEEHGLTCNKPKFNTIAWDFLIGPGSMSPRDWIIYKFIESRELNKSGFVTIEKLQIEA